MPQAKTFGRRQATPSDALSLSPAAEAFRDELAERGATATDEFARFKRERRGRMFGVWMLRLLFCAPGLLCAAVGAPSWLSIVLEVAGVGCGAWIRQERRRQLKEIAAWEPET